MSSENFPLRQSGIYRNLPTFNPSIKDLKAIVCGATGISGFPAMRALLDTPDRWSKIYALSRNPPSAEMLSLLRPDQRSRIQHVSVDLLKSAESVSESLTSAGITAVDHAFFFSYFEPSNESGEGRWSNGEELTQVNKALLDNFLQGMALSEIKPRRVLLQTGAKHYGILSGRVRTPMVESDPRHPSPGREPNFYFALEDSLFEFCKSHPGTDWNVIRPASIIGATSSSQTNGFISFAVYAAVQAQRKKPLLFGGDFEAWQYEFYHSTARLTGYLAEWAVLEDKCANQVFNANDNSPLTFNRFFTELARWYGVESGVLPPETYQAKFRTTAEFPTAGVKVQETALGYGPPLRKLQSFELKDWAADPAQAQAWKEIMTQNQNLVSDPFEECSNDKIKRSTYFNGDFLYLRYGQLSTNKAKQFGFTGFVNTLESIHEMYEEMAALGLIPGMKVDGDGGDGDGDGDGDGGSSDTRPSV